MKADFKIIYSYKNNNNKFKLKFKNSILKTINKNNLNDKIRNKKENTFDKFNECLTDFNFKFVFSYL
jgi:hypothetical protein